MTKLVVSRDYFPDPNCAPTLEEKHSAALWPLADLGVELLLEVCAPSEDGSCPGLAYIETSQAREVGSDERYDISFSDVFYAMVRDASTDARIDEPAARRIVARWLRDEAEKLMPSGSMGGQHE